jgi:hypothetical protein
VYGHLVHETRDIPMRDAICHLSTVDPSVGPIFPWLIGKSRFAISQLLLLCSQDSRYPDTRCQLASTTELSTFGKIRFRVIASLELTRSGLTNPRTPMNLYPRVPCFYREFSHREIGTCAVVILCPHGSPTPDPRWYLALTPARVDLLTPVLPRCIGVREFVNPKPMSSGTCLFPNLDLRSFGVARHLSTTLTLVVPTLSLYPSGNRVSGYRDSRCHVHGTFNSPISDSAGSPDTCPCCLDGSDPIGKSRIAISTCTSLLSPETPILRFMTLWDLLPRVPAVWMALILSGNRGSRFQHAREKPRFSDSRLFGISCHSTLLKSPMGKIPMPPQNADACPAEING